MDVRTTDIQGVLTLLPARLADERGFFSEVFRKDVLERHGVHHDWGQDNHSHSRSRGVVRGLHFQVPPHAQAKLIRVIRGAIFDVAVDLRKGSATYGRHVAVELSAANWLQLYVPPGFAHGFCTLEGDTEVIYKVAGKYDPASERGLLWNDPSLAIAWPVFTQEMTLNHRDSQWPQFRTFDSPFSL